MADPPDDSGAAHVQDQPAVRLLNPRGRGGKAGTALTLRPLAPSPPDLIPPSGSEGRRTVVYRSSVSRISTTWFLATPANDWRVPLAGHWTSTSTTRAAFPRPMCCS